MATKEEAINFLNSEYQQTYEEFIKKLTYMIKQYVIGKYQVGPRDPDPEFEKDFAELFDTIKNIKVEFIPYSEITRVMYDNEIDIITFDSFFFKFNSAISDGIKRDVGDGKSISNCYTNLIKISEHLKLADKQLRKLYMRQDKELEKQDQELSELQKSTSKMKNTVKAVENIKAAIYSDVTTILGIFAAIIFTLFGGVNIFSKAVKQITTKTNLWRGGIVLTIFGIIIFCLMSFLMESIAMITGRISANFDKRKYCWQRHPFWTVLVVLVIILLICIIGGKITHAF
ncbi:hypothetical protein PT281_00860 [Lactobacillus sp. ESL0701]|uniref:hypothetical protein n=1 Tax=Lactobacillus sp. ESL0701 TaxID=2983217 RepID=UPI0023FA0D5E|nr:hypothetical protein [Lactobacillus sp. ESL0701]MDF7671836.1 hypothetical protein [Lactobacillus sp. ESL0701]